MNPAVCLVSLQMRMRMLDLTLEQRNSILFASHSALAVLRLIQSYKDMNIPSPALGELARTLFVSTGELRPDLKGAGQASGTAVFGDEFDAGAIGWLEEIFVYEEYRGLGVGTFMLKKLFSVRLDLLLWCI